MTAAAQRETSHSPGFRVQGLEMFLSRTVAGFRGPVIVRQISEDSGSETYVLTTPGEHFVLRCKSDGETPAHMQPIEREFHILACLNAKGFPTPRPLIYSDDTAIIGKPFYVMTHVDGRTFDRAALPGVVTADRAAIYDAMNDTLARMHGYDPHELGLGGMGRNAGYLAGQVAAWARVYLAHRRDDIPEMDRLTAWLPDHLPPERPLRLMHGDYGLGKLIFDAGDIRIKAVTDWRRAALGDPIADLVHHSMIWTIPPAEGGGALSRLDLADLGIPTLERYLAAYASRTGIGEVPHLNGYMAYTLFRAAAIDLARPEHLMRAKTLAKLGWAFAQRASRD